MDWNPIRIIKGTADSVNVAAEKLAQATVYSAKTFIRDVAKIEADASNSARGVANDLAMHRFKDGGKDAAIGLADTYENVASTGDHALQSVLPCLSLADSKKDSVSSPASSANEVLHSDVFMQGGGVLSDSFFRHDAHSNVSDCASAWDLGQILEADAAMHDLRKFDSDMSIMEQYRGGTSPADLAYNTFGGGKNSSLGFDSGWKPVIGANADQYYDDNAWIGIALMDADKLHANSKYLNEAKKIMDLELQGAQGTDKMPLPGGEFWCREKDYRNTVTSAGTAQLALMLYDRVKTNEPELASKYLQFAEQQFDWVNKNLKAENGLFADGVQSDGKIEPRQYSYNQGLMLGDATMLFQITGDEKYLDQAKEIANKSLQEFRNDELTFFNTVFYKNLMHLDTVMRSTPGQEPNPAYLQSLAEYSKYLQNEINPHTGVISTRDVHDNNDLGATALDQASAVQIFQLAEAYVDRKS